MTCAALLFLVIRIHAYSLGIFLFDDDSVVVVGGNCVWTTLRYWGWKESSTSNKTTIKRNNFSSKQNQNSCNKKMKLDSWSYGGNHGPMGEI